MAETGVNAGQKTEFVRGGDARNRTVRSRNVRGRGRFGSRFGRRGGENVVDFSRRMRRRFEEKESVWAPKTEIGKKVASGEIKSIDEILEKNIRIKEPEIVDRLLPNLVEEIIENKRVQRVTMNGRVMRFKVVMAVGDKDGHIGLGQGKAKEVPVAIAQAIRVAKLNIKKINRGCGSWFCNCGRPHTIPITMVGNSGSVSVKLIPAVGGLGLVAGEITKKVLALAGIKDVWSWSTGHTRTALNSAQAAIDALIKCKEIKK